MGECIPPEQHISKGNSSSSLPTPSGFRVTPAWGHSAQSCVPVQLSLPMGPCTPQLHKQTANYQLLYTEDGAVRAGSSYHQICPSRPCCGDSRNKAMAGGVFSKWSCQVLEQRNQRQASLIATGEDNLSRYGWHKTRFGATPPLAQTLSHTDPSKSPWGFHWNFSSICSFSHSFKSTYKLTICFKINQSYKK